jgi:hypothetical protein
VAERAKNRGKSPFGEGGYSNGTGHFYFNDPLPVIGIIDGVHRALFGRGTLPCSYLIVTDVGIEW